MSNTIDKNLERGNNSMKPLTFTWIALFEDNSRLEQFENGIENQFKEVKNKFSQLVKFSLVNKDYSQCFSVDLINGIISYNNLSSFNLKNNKKNNIRLIYFRRHKVEMTEKIIEKSHIIEYHLGLQWSNKEGKNIQAILVIKENGNWNLEV